MSEPWQIMDRSLHVHLNLHRLHITRREGDDGNSFNTLSWDVLGQAKKSKDKLDFKPGLAVQGDFTLGFLVKEAIDVPMHEGGPKVPCLLLGRQPSRHSDCYPHLHVPAPTHGNLRGPITDGPLSHLEHACLPWRLLAGYKWLDFKSNKDGKACISGECPAADKRPRPSLSPVRKYWDASIFSSLLSYSRTSATSGHDKRGRGHPPQRKTVTKRRLVCSAPLCPW
jgi:hypothetical protein